MHLKVDAVTNGCILSEESEQEVNSGWKREIVEFCKLLVKEIEAISSGKSADRSDVPAGLFLVQISSVYTTRFASNTFKDTALYVKRDMSLYFRVLTAIKGGYVVQV